MITRASKFFGVSALLAAMLPAIHANAAGFQVSEHSAAGLGRAFAGEAAVADDASVVARNPAGMSLLDRTTLTVVGSVIFPEIKVEALDGTSHGSNSVGEDAFVPAAYLVMPYNDKITFGFGANTNYGLGTKYGTHSNFSTEGAESEIISVNFNTSIAYQMNDRLSFGFGLNAVHAEAKLVSKPSPSVTAMDMEGDDWGFGWNAGMLFQLTPATRIGLSYRSEVDLKLDGKSKTDIPDSFNGALQDALQVYNSPGSVDLELPAIAELSVNHQLTDTLSLQASWQRTYWSSFEEIRIKFDQVGAQDHVVEENWSDADRLSLGVTWQYSPALTLRAGIARDESPVSSHFRTFRIPDADRMWYTIGAGYKFSENSSIDAGYAYLTGDSVKVYETDPEHHGEVTKTAAHIFALQYNYKF